MSEIIASFRNAWSILEFLGVNLLKTCLERDLAEIQWVYTHSKFDYVPLLKFYI